MKPSEIDIDSFYTAHSLAKQSISEDRWENEFTEKLTQFLVAELSRARVESVLADSNEAGKKIKGALDEIQRNKGIEFMTEYRIALMAALEHTMAARMTYSDMPESVKKSGLFKLEIENTSEDQK